MKVTDMEGKRVVIWGVGREGMAAAALLRRVLPGLGLTFIDENGERGAQACAEFGPLLTGEKDIAAALDMAEVVVKSPGVSLYHPLVQRAKERGCVVTSLLNLWFSLPRQAKTICVTGTKGKSTTAALIAHMLNGLGRKTALAGNIGLAVGTQHDEDNEYIVVEMSSYQAADFSQSCDVAVLTSLYPEHLDWHGSLERYYRDKLNLLSHAQAKIVHAQCLDIMRDLGVPGNGVMKTSVPEGFHVHGDALLEKETPLPDIRNAYLQRAHNRANLCMALAVIRHLGLDVITAMETLEDFQGLPHRQQELGIRNGVLYVDDSISTTPQSAIAAMENYAGRPISLIAGGHDRGIDYSPLAEYLREKNIHAVICMGPSGARIYKMLEAQGKSGVFLSTGMKDAVALARERTPFGGVILLSPAAPSYGLFRDFAARGDAFSAESGFDVSRNA